MLFSRRKHATAVEPATPAESPVAGASPDLNDTASPAAAAPGSPPNSDITSPGTPGPPTVPVAAPPVAPPPPPPGSSMSIGPGPAPDEESPAPDEESGDTDLDRFFAALRQVVHDAREALPVEAQPDTETEVMPASTGPAAQETSGDPSGSLMPTRRDPVAGGAPASMTTELAPSTAELVSSLEADRDLWRERAVVWRERAMGADMLVKALNEHMSDLQVNLEDLRMAMRFLSNETSDAPEPRAELSAGGSTWGGLDPYLESGA